MADVLITVGIDPKVDYSDFKKGVNDLVAGISASTKPVKIKVELDDTSVAKIKQELSTIHQLAATASKGGVGLSSSSKRAPKTSMARSLDAEKRSIEANIKAKQEYIRMTQQMGMADNAEAQAKKAAAKAQSEFITDVKEQNKELKKLQTARNNIVRDLKKNAAKNDTGDAGKAYAKLSDYKSELDLLEGQLLDRSITREKYNKTIEDIINGEKVASKAIRDAGKDYQTLGSRFGGLVKKFTTWLSVSQGVMYAVNSVKKMAQETIKVDTAMTELKKVTDETDASYERFLTSATSRSKKLGSSLSDTISATADFARLGYSIEDAEKISDAAVVYKNVGDGIADINEASESVISTMQAFGLGANDAMTIVDKFNEVGNNYAISSQGVGEALKRSAAAMKAANNTLDETIALATAANTIVQNPEVVGKHNMPSNAVMYCKQIAISVKGWRQFRPRKDFMMYKSNTEIALMCA